jgi:hypothetical protein
LLNVERMRQIDRDCANVTKTRQRRGDWSQAIKEALQEKHYFT